MQVRISSGTQRKPSTRPSLCRLAFPQVLNGHPQIGHCYAGSHSLRCPTEVPKSVKAMRVSIPSGAQRSPSMRSLLCRFAFSRVRNGAPQIGQGFAGWHPFRYPTEILNTVCNRQRHVCIKWHHHCHAFIHKLHHCNQKFIIMRCKHHIPIPLITTGTYHI